MATNIERIADLLGARRVSEVADTAGGAFGAYRLAEIVARLRHRHTPSRRPAGSPPAAQWVHHPPLPMSAATFEKLNELAAKASSPDRLVAPMELAALIFEEAIARCASAT